MSSSAVVAGGIVFALLAAAAQTASFFCTRIFVTRMHGGPLKLMVLGHVIMGVMSIAALAILLPGRGVPPVWACMGPLFTASLCYMLGQLSMFVALRYTEASRTAPLLGLKIVMLAFITTVFMDQHLGLAQWSAVGLAVLAAFAINFTGGSMPWQGVLGVVGACLPYSLSDLNVSTLVNLLDGGYGWHAPLVAVSLSYALCGLVSLLLLPWTGIGTRQDYRYAAPFAALWFLAMILLFAAFGLIGPVYGNIVQSSRGLMTVFAGAALAYMGMVHIEGRTTRRVFFQRLAGAAMMVGAIALY